jgi:Succinylglutamate desuccinylase / Aspartoacylase family
MDEEHYATEYPVPDIAPYARGNTGIDYVHTFDSGRPGPHVVINALTHGNEVCGAYAVDRLFRWDARPARGKLTLSFANVDAFVRFSVERPAETRWVDEDFNRVWSDDKLDGPRTSSELTRARALRPAVAAADLLLDLHSMHLPAPAVMIAGPHAKGRELARRIGLPAFVISDSGHATGARMRDYRAFGDAASPRNALLVECGQHGEASAAQTALDASLAFLREAGIMGAEFFAAHPSPGPIPQRFVQVTHPVIIRSERFEFTQRWTGMETIERAGTVIGHDGGEPVTTPYDQCILVMPAPLRYVRPGFTAVRLGRVID